MNRYFNIHTRIFFAIIKGCMVTAGCFLWAISCRKNDHPGQPVSPAAIDSFENVRVKTATGADGLAGNLATYTYDSQGRVAKITETYRTIEYSYAGNTVTQKTTENGNTTIKYYELNPQGYIKADTITGADPVIYRYEYNDKGFHTKTYDDRVPQYQARYYYNNTNGLPDSVCSAIGDNWNSTTTYSYDISKYNSLENINFGMAFMGKMFTRPVKRQEYKYSDNGIVKTQITDMELSYDDAGRIKSRSYVEAGTHYTTHYTYY